MTPDDLGRRLAQLIEPTTSRAPPSACSTGGGRHGRGRGGQPRHGGRGHPDTVFQIGSQGKMWTATVLMQLVDEGRVALDAPVRTYLPTFSVADRTVPRR